ncbi:MAG: glycosyltransferase [Chloroflexota bacterium]
MSQNIIIYANKVSRRSETFIYNPALIMQRYYPYFVGSRRGDGLPLPQERVFIVNGKGRYGRYRQRLMYTLLGHAGISLIANRLKPLQPQLIQSHFGFDAVDSVPLAKRLGIPLIVYYHGFDATFTLDYAESNTHLTRYLHQLPNIIEEVTLVLTASDFLRQRVLDLGYSPEKVRTHYIGIDPVTEPPLPFEKREKRVVFVARLVDKKGTSYLIDAMQLVQQKYPELELVIVGDGINREALESQAESLPNCRFVGWQSPEQVDQWMKTSLIFSVPSVEAQNGDSEGFGMVFIEAQRVGTPVVSTHHGGIVESVLDGETGLLVPERNAVALAQAIIRLYTDHDLWRTFSQAGYDRVQREFGLQTLTAKLETIYDEVLSDSH